MLGLRAPALSAAAVALSLALSGCSGGTSSSAETSTPDRSTTSGPTSSAPPTSAHPEPEPPPAPEVGECRALTYSDISLFASKDDPISCAREHTAYTFAVGKLPARVAFEGVEIQNDAVQSKAAQVCTSRFADFVGGDTDTRTLSRLTVTYFLPDQQGFDRGARWIRCDIVAVQSPNSLAPLPEKLQGYLDDDSALNDFGVCSRGEPGAADSVLVMCSQDHAYRAVSALRLGGADAAYPATSVVDDGQQRCESLIGKLLGVTGGFTYSWTFPSSGDWADGQRFGYCWNQTEK